MNRAAARDHLLALPHAWEDWPFGPDVAVYKVGNRMFATLTELRDSTHMNLKCDPEEALFLRDMFDAVQPGYHMNKVHWNTVRLDGSIPVSELERMMDASYALVFRGLPRAARQRIGGAPPG
jgi:predicted DNA-binding protein (MmcQ/YjbR family)